MVELRLEEGLMAVYMITPEGERDRVADYARQRP
jgi:hypothetical protein